MFFFKLKKMFKIVLEILWLNLGKLYKRLLIESFEDFFLIFLSFIVIKNVRCWC